MLRMTKGAFVILVYSLRKMHIHYKVSSLERIVETLSAKSDCKDVIERSVCEWMERLEEIY